MCVCVCVCVSDQLKAEIACTLIFIFSAVFISIWYKNRRHEALWFCGEGEGTGHDITNCLRDPS